MMKWIEDASLLTWAGAMLWHFVWLASNIECNTFVGSVRTWGIQLVLILGSVAVVRLIDWLGCSQYSCRYG